MIALIGLPGNGKTYTINLLKKEGYSILIVDDFFSEQYKVGNECYELIKKYLGHSYVNKKEVNRKKLRNFASENMNFLEKIVHPILKKHLLVNTYDFVEIPIINSKHVNFYELFSHVVNITYPSSSQIPITSLKKLIIDRQKNAINKPDVIHIHSGDIEKLKLMVPKKTI